MARLKQWIPSEEDYARQVALMEVEVKGKYVANGQIKKLTQNYRIKLVMPDGFNASDIKRMTARFLADDEVKYGDFVALYTFEVVGKPKIIPKKVGTLGDFYSDFDKSRHARQRAGRAEWVKRQKMIYMQHHGSLEGVDEETMLPEFSGSVPSRAE